MKKLLLLPTLSFLLHCSLNAQWVSANGPYGGSVWELYANDDYVFATKPSGLYRSADAGLNWEKCDNASYNRLVLSNQNLLLKASANVFPQFRYSSDNGDHWQEVPIPSSVPYAQNFTIKDHVILFNYADTLWQTDDFGQHWTGFQVSGELFHSYNYLKTIDSRFYLGNKKRLLSSDDGLNWNYISTTTGTVSEYIKDLYGSSDSVLLVQVGKTVSRSLDGGLHWDLTSGPSFEGFSSQPVNFARINDTYFTSTGSKLLYSADKGLTWDFTNPNGPKFETLASFENTLVGGNSNDALSRSTDFGLTFQPANKHLDGGDVYALSIKDNDLWLWGNKGIERQNTDQLNWSLPLIFSNQMDWERYQTIYHFKNAVFIREEFGNVLRTLDGGQTWTNVTPGSIVPISHVVKFEQKNDTLYFLAEFGRTWQTTDLGDHWEQISAGINAQIGENMSDLTVQGSQVFINGGGNIYRSEDNLQSWQLVADFMQFGAATPWIGLSATSHYLSAWVNYERFFVSNDQGQNWLEGSFPFPPFFAQTYDDRFYFAEIGNVLVAVFQHGGAFVSSDQGGTWQDFNQGIPNIESTTTFAKNDSTLWLGTRDFGLFKRSISDLPTVSTSQPLSEQNVLKIFPNPTQGAFSCKIPLKISGEATLTVFDLQGKQMLRRTDSTEHLPKIDLSRCAKGVYWVSIATPQGVFGGKVVVQ